MAVSISRLGTEALSLRVPVLRGLATIGLAVTGWYLIAQPLEAGLSSRRRDLADASVRIKQFQIESAADPDYAAVVDALAKRGQTLNNWTAKCPEGSRLYDGFQALAAQNKVKIVRIEPRSKTGNESRGAGVSAADAAAIPQSVIDYAIDVTGTYPAVARFIEAIESDLGSSRVANFRVTPSARTVTLAGDDGQTVDATIETTHVHMTIPLDLSAATGALGGGQ